MPDDVGLVIGRHALEQLARRDPVFAASTKTLVGAMFHEIHDAIENERMGAHKPSWTRQTKGNLSRRSEQVRKRRFVWNEERTRCYVLVPARKEQCVEPERFRRVWFVMTAYTRHEPRAAAAA